MSRVERNLCVQGTVSGSLANVLMQQISLNTSRCFFLPFGYFDLKSDVARLLLFKTFTDLLVWLIKTAWVHYCLIVSLVSIHMIELTGKELYTLLGCFVLRQWQRCHCLIYHKTQVELYMNFFAHRLCVEKNITTGLPACLSILYPRDIFSQEFC